MNISNNVLLGTTLVAIIIAIASIAITTNQMIELEEEKNEAKRFYVESFVADMLREHYVQGDSYLDVITNAQTLSKYYPFALDFETLKIVAHGADSSIVGEISVVLENADKPIEQIKSELKANGSTWLTYQWMDYESETIKTKHSYLVLNGNTILGSGYYD